MRRLRVLGIVCFGVILAACSQAPTFPEGIATGSAEAQDYQLPGATLESSVLAFGEIYFVLRTIATPFDYEMVRMPAECLLTEAACPDLEQILGFPNAEPSPSLFSWSPDHELALLYSSYYTQLLAFEPRGPELRVIATDLSITTDQIEWAADGQWAAVSVQDPDPYSSHIALVDASGERRDLDLSLDGMLSPVGWLGTGELIVHAREYGLPGTDPLQKQVPIADALYAVDIPGGQWIELRRDVGPPLGSIELSPGAESMVFSMPGDGVSLVAMKSDGTEVVLLSECGMLPAWAPDGEWIAAVCRGEGGNLVFVMHPDGSEIRDIIRSHSVPLVMWLGDDHLLVVADLMEEPPPGEGRQLYLASIHDGTIKRIIMPGLDWNTQVIARMSWRPVVSP